MFHSIFLLIPPSRERGPGRSGGYHRLKDRHFFLDPEQAPQELLAWKIPQHGKTKGLLLFASNSSLHSDASPPALTWHCSLAPTLGLINPVRLPSHPQPLRYPHPQQPQITMTIKRSASAAYFVMLYDVLTKHGTTSIGSNYYLLLFDCLYAIKIP